MSIAAGPHRDEEYTLPSAEALLAGTLALMTGHVQATQTRLRQQLADQIAANLSSLACAPTVSPGFAALLRALHQRWQTQGALACGNTIPPHSRTLWCLPPATLQ